MPGLNITKIDENICGAMSSGELGDPFMLGDLQITPDKWGRERINAMYPHKDMDGKKRYIVATASGEYEMKSLADAPDYLIFVNDEPVTVASKIYQPVTHYEVLRAFKDKLEEQRIEYNKIVLNKWGMNMRCIAFTNEFKVKEDAHKMGFFVRNSLDKKGAISAGIYVMRMVCSNGLIVPRMEGDKRKHTFQSSAIGQFNNVLDNLLSVNIKATDVENEFLELSKTDADQEWLTKAAVELQLRKWELETISNLEFEYPIKGNLNGYVKPATHLETYSKWDFLVDVTAVAKTSRVGDGDRKVNMNRAVYLEEAILECVRR